MLAKRDEKGPAVVWAWVALTFAAGCELAPRLLNRLPPNGALGADAGGWRKVLEDADVEAGVTLREKGDLDVVVPKSDILTCTLGA